MKILILNSEYPPLGGGAGNATANLARALAGNDVSIKVITAQFGQLPRHEKSFGFEIYRIPALRSRLDRSGPFEQFCFFVSSIFFSIKLFKSWKPNLIWTFFGIPCGAVGLVLKRLFGIPFIISLRGGDVPGFRPYDFAFYHHLLAPLIKHLWKKADAVVANSAGLRQLALNFYSEQEIYTIPNGVDLDFFHPNERDWNAANILFLGRVVYQKGLDILIQSLDELRDQEWKLEIVGDGSYRETLLSLVAQYGLEERVQFIDWQLKDALPSIYSRATIFVYPSRHEGMPNSVLEAMASGLPIVATAIAGNEELVVPQKNGFLVKPEDVPDLANALRMLITDVEKRKTMGMASRKIVEENFDWRKSADQYMNLIKGLVTK